MSYQDNISYSFKVLKEHGEPTKLSKISEKREISYSEVEALSAFT